MKKDAFGHNLLIKRFLVLTLGALTYPRYRWTHNLKIEGLEHLENLPRKGVLFVSNHQTYFAEVILLYHIFSAQKRGRKNINSPIYLLNPIVRFYFIAAVETMKSGLLPRLFEYVGSVSIKRTWREAGKDVNRKVDLGDISKIGRAIDDGWVITFPQGTTKAFAPGRRGTAHVVKKFEPIVVPIVLDGFRRGFDKKGLRIKKKGATLTVRFKEPMKFNFEDDSQTILDQLMDNIEQSDRFNPAAKTSA